MTVLDRKLITRMVNPQPGGNGGGGGYVPPSQDVSWTDINGKPTTLSGYGITDAYWATTQSTSDKRNLTIGSVTQQVITAHQSLYGYATEYWVGQQGFATQKWVDNNYLPLTGGTVTGNIYIGNTTIYASGSNGGINSLAVADDCILGDCNIGGHLGLKSLNTNNAGISFYNSSGSQVGQLSAYNGNIGIGTDSPSYKLHVVGRIYCTGGFAFLSDIRKKDVIAKDLHISVGDIAKAPLIRYTLKSDEKKEIHIGSVAQYWQDVMPETINKSNDGTLSMDYGTISLVSVVTLARKLETLEKELSDIKKKLITK